MRSSSSQVRTSTTAKSPMLGIAANTLHELNNKLGIIVTECDLISLHAASDATLGRHVNTIRNAANDIGGVLSKLLAEYAKKEVV
jgi:hypothetical protein